MFIRKYDLERHLQSTVHQDDMDLVEEEDEEKQRRHKRIHVEDISDLMEQDNPEHNETCIY